MKKIKFISLIICTGLFLSSCVSTKETTAPAEPETVVIEKEPVPVAPKKEEPKQKKPEDPPNVKFVKLLQEKLAANDISGAIALFEEMPEELKSDIELRLLQGALYYSDTQFENAISVANEVLAIESTNLDALELISLCNHAMGDKKAYQETSKQILAVDPYNTSANIQKAEDLVLNKKYKLARDAYKKALRNEPENQDALFGYAQTSYYVSDFKTSGETLNKMLELNPENPQAYSYLGKIEAEKENWRQAAMYVEKAIQLDQNNYDYYLDYGNYNRYLGKYADAEKAWILATKVDPDYFLAYAYLAGIYDEQNMFDKALENYHMVIKTNPKYYYAYEETAILEYHSGNYESAIKYFQKAFEYSQSYAYMLMCYACYYKLGNQFKGKELLSQYLKKMNKEETEYSLVRFFADNYSHNAEVSLVQKVSKEENGNKRGKMLFYLGLYYELNGADLLCAEYYAKVVDMNAPMFFEYRIAEWGLNK